MINRSESDFYISVKEMHAISGISVPTLYRWIQLDLIPAMHLGPNGRTKKVLRSQFMEMLKASTKGVAFEKVVEDQSWFKPQPLHPRRVHAREGQMFAMSDQPKQSGQFLKALAKVASLEKRYGLGTATVAAKLARHEQLPPPLTPKKAQEWVAAFERATNYSGRE